MSFADTVPEGDFYLAALAVDATRRGEGIGTALLEHTLERARSAGSKRIVLDVDSDNDGGRRLYERWGMTVEAESPVVAVHAKTTSTADGETAVNPNAITSENARQ